MYLKITPILKLNVINLIIKLFYITIFVVFPKVYASTTFWLCFPELHIGNFNYL